MHAGSIKVVGVFRSEESAEKVRTRLGNPTEDQFVSIVGSFGKCINHIIYYSVTKKKYRPLILKAYKKVLP